MALKSPVALVGNESLTLDEATERIHKMNDSVNARLAAILGRQCHIDAKMNGIGRALAGLRHIHSDAGHLHSTISGTALLAQNVSAKVRRLDEARTRVSECQQRVHDLIDLQLCAAGVTAAIDAENFEEAAGHIHRFLGMDRSLLQRTAADSSDDGGAGGSAGGSGGAEADGTSVGRHDTIVQAVATLDAAAAQLRQLITVRFDESVARDDLASVERFFKIFPLLRMHDTGIERFSDYICTKLQARAARELRTALDVAKANRRTAVAYADTLTTMFENLARVVEVNQPIVESCYGHGHLVRMVVRLQRECDEQFRRLLHEFQNGRHVPHRMTQIDEQLAAKSCALASVGPTGSGSGSNSGSTTASTTGNTTNKGHSRHKSGGGSLDKLNPKDIDGLLGEITVMLSRADLYVRFMRRKVTADLDRAAATGATGSTGAADDEEDHEQTRKLKTQLFEDTISRCDLSRQTQELLNIYLLFERYFIEESVLKAIALDAHEPGQPCSSMVDDCFFIARKSIRRAASTQSLSGCCAVINMATAVLDTDLVQAVHAALRAGYPSGYIDLAAHAYNALHTSIQLGGKLPANNDMSGDRARVQFVVQLNNADQAGEHVETLCQQMGAEIRAAAAAVQATAREREILDSCLGALRAVRDRMRAEVEFGLQQLRSSVLRPRLHTWIVDRFVAVGHEPSEEELAVYETGETFVQALIVQLDGLLAQFRPPVMAEGNYGRLVAMLAADVTARMEAAIGKCTFNRLGGLVLDREVRALGQFLSGATAWSVRDKMVRLTQMATLLNLEQVSELSEYWQPSEHSTSGPAWHFSHAEVKSILSLRSDFRTTDIKRIKL